MLPDLPQDEGADRRLRTVDPVVAAGDEAGEIPLRRYRGEHRPDAFPRQFRIEQGAHQGMIEEIVQPDAEAAEFLCHPVAAKRHVGALVDRIEHRVPADQVAQGVKVTLAGKRRRQRRRQGRPGGVRARHRHGEAEFRHLLEIIAQHRDLAAGAAGAQIEIAEARELGFQVLERVVEGRHQRRRRAGHGDLMARGGSRQQAGLRIEDPGGEIAVLHRVEAEDQQHPEAQAPFAECRRLPAAAQGLGRRLVVAPVQPRPCMLERQRHVGAVNRPRPQGKTRRGRREGGEGRRARGEGTGRNRQSQRQIGHLRRIDAIPRVPVTAGRNRHVPLNANAAAGSRYR